MTIYNFMSNNQILTFILAVVVGINALVATAVLWGLIRILLFGLPNRILRHWNIRKHGWPPAHCDADGDFREGEPVKEEE